ncbi:MULTISPECIES: DUF4148 domain-containing protein [Paraburkholderia]|jgi:hypothetical protein|uniref:DUF4148 domain-containing protein n=1 Tax=Paraburkholderia TaxID=1822464 RepID=UPI00190C9CEF|nr:MULTISPECIES: DUF4148 domain-containing protein [Paraburkholderia]MBK5051651.1 hypothetical protein [Burkholderia sp. R-70006]MBK5185209.1 hypothetical protein [Burkholderia sp. R-69749]MCI0151670.1 hypothetical protein [Paraburkholderia sediminicola]MBK3843826.1 hypothetical protein [Paraburkholderia aspalathi]CAE6790400.1 hypothetical protein R70006_04821 [Paraburkholderia domus]
MFQIRKRVITAVASAALFGLTVPVAMAQNAAPDSVASTPKQVQKAQRKAARKEARAKKNAELRNLEKNGSVPGSDDVHYPQDPQNAQTKYAPAKPDPNK